MKYIEFVNNLIKEEVFKPEKLVLFGQNINAGSCLGGLTRGLKIQKNSRIIDSTNSENSLCGFGFGLMLGEISSIFFMKQLDFLLLGIDHLVNTYNIIRNHKNNSSFTIMPIIVDNGFQGPHSSLNNFGDFCSMTRVHGYTITNKLDAKKIIKSKLISKGFRIIGVSQRLFKQDILEPEAIIYSNEDLTVFQYSKGNDVTIVCFNFAFPQGWNLYQELEQKKINASLFNVNSPTSTDWSKIIDDVKITKKLIVIDDSKSNNVVCDSLLSDIHGLCMLEKRIILKKIIYNDWLNPNSDQMEVNNKKIIDELTT